MEGHHTMTTAHSSNDPIRQNKTERSLQLARAADMGASAAHCVDVRIGNQGRLHSVIVTVRSRSDYDSAYTVTYVAPLDHALCDCPAGRYGRACCHAGVAILYGRIAADCYTPIAAAASRREQSIDNDKRLSY